MAETTMNHALFAAENTEPMAVSDLPHGGADVGRETPQSNSIKSVLSGESRWCVVTGECQRVLPSIPDRTIDHVFSDPPFEAEAHTLQRRVKRGKHTPGVDNRVAGSEALSFELRSVAGAEMARLARRWVAVFCQCEATQLWRSALEPLTYRRTGVWVKPDAMPQYSGDRPGMGYESIVFAHAAGRSKWNGGGARRRIRSQQEQRRQARARDAKAGAADV